MRTFLSYQVQTGWSEEAMESILRTFDHLVSMGIIRLVEIAIQIGPIIFIEEPYIARITNGERVMGRIFVTDLYQLIFREKGVCDESLDLCHKIAMARFNTKLNIIAAKAQEPLLMTAPEDNRVPKFLL